MSTRASLLACLAASLVACKERPPKVIVAKDRSAQITVPDGWTEDPELAAAASVQASRRSDELYVVVVSEARADLKDSDVEDYSELARSRQLASMEGASETPLERKVLNGFPALQSELRGSVAGDRRVVMLHAAVQTRYRYLQVLAWTLEDRWDRSRATLQTVVDSAQVPGERPGRGWGDPNPGEPTEMKSADGSLRMTVPAKWTAASDLNEGAELQAARRGVAAFVIVLVDHKSKVPDMDLAQISSLGRAPLCSRRGRRERKPRPSG